LPPGITASSYNPFTGILTLTGSATLAEYQTALHQVVFDTTSTSTADRIIQVTVNDGTSDSNVGTTYMHVVVPPPNVPPALDLDANDSTTPGANYLTTFTDGGPAVAVVDTDVSVIDNDSPTLASATVTLTNPQALDSLTFNGAPPGTIAVSGTGTNVITLTGVSSLADYQLALQQVRFSNTDTNPSTETRHRHCRQRRRQQQQHGTGLDPGRGGEQQRSGAGPRCRRLERLVSNHFPEHVHRKRLAGTDRRCGYLHHGSRQHPPRVRHDHAG
jgi:hypothetical protein